MSSGRNFTMPVMRDSLVTAIIKNVITVFLFITINYINSTLVHTFTRHQVFNMNPRYILYIHLVINDIILLTMFTLVQVLSYIIFTINVPFCIFLLMVAIYANMNNPLTLAVMAVECYIAICFPLRHAQICTVKKTYMVITVIWMLSSLSVLPDLFVTLATESMEFFHSRFFCVRNNVFRSPQLKEKRLQSNRVFLVVVWLTLFYSYLRILFTAKTAAADTKKARNTVLLHGFQLLLCMLTYGYNVMMEGLMYLFPKHVLTIRFVVPILVQVLPRFLSPVIYGIRDQTFRKYLKRYFFGKILINTQTHKR